MKKSILILSCLLSWSIPNELCAQVKPKKKSSEDTESTTKPSKSRNTDDLFDESGGFKHRLQYMIHLNQNLFSISRNSFALRIDPSVGYKLTPWASAGLTSSVNYTYLRLTDGSITATMRAFDYSYGLYARLKAIYGLYAHADYKWATYEVPRTDSQGNVYLSPTNPNRIQTVKQIGVPEMNVGLAYRQGGGSWGYEILVLYDAIMPANSFKAGPLDIKIGFSYNF